MFKKILTFTMLIFVIVGLGIGVYFATSSQVEFVAEKETDDAIFGNVQTKPIKVSEFFTYGKCFNFTGTLSNVSKDNFESAKIYLTDGNEFEKTYSLTGEFEDGNLILTTSNKINSGLNLDKLPVGEYILIVRLRLNNSVDPKYYLLSNDSEYNDIEYYTVTKEGTNNKISISFNNKQYNGHEYSYLGINVENSDLPGDVYDVVIDAGHGGKDIGEKSGTDTESDIALNYSNLLKQNLEAQGLKVKQTRTNENTDTFTETNTYDDTGRISIACSSKAKLMISLHLNNGNMGLRGLEIYSPSNSKLEFAQNMANNIIEMTDIDYSNNNSFKEGEGVYVRNFTKSVINEYENTAKRKGYEPYNITLDTPYLFTIREVGGIATNAYVDGRNKSYSANKYYNSNQGIECYQIEMGYIKNDLEIIKTQMDQYVTAIVKAITENY